MSTIFPLKEIGNKFLESTKFYGLSQYFAVVESLLVMAYTGQPTKKIIHSEVMVDSQVRVLVSNEGKIKLYHQIKEIAMSKVLLKRVSIKCANLYSGQKQVGHFNQGSSQHQSVHVEY